jgi:membrane fusion protein, heavy metal efflux system
MKKNILRISTILLLSFMVVSCGNNTTKKNVENNHEEHGEEAGHDEEEGHNEEESPNKVSLQLAQLKVMDVELGEIKQVNLGATLKVNGQLELPPQNKASVSAIIGGRVESVAVIEGDFVKKGQVIARLNNPEFITMQRDYLSAKSSIVFLEKDYQRKKELLKEGITSARVFQQAEADYLEGKADLTATKSTLQLMGINLSTLDKGKITATIPVIAPIKGYIQNVEVNIGKSIVPEQEMFEIVDNEHLHIGLKVFEKDIDKAKVGQKITFALTTRPDKIYEAEIFALGRAFDMDTRAVKVHAKITGNHEGLLTGMFVEARIAIDRKEVNALPNEAFVRENGLDYIFIQMKKDESDVELEKIQVNKGISDLGYSEVVFIKQTHKDSIVVTKGAYYVNAELNKGEFEEHEH